MFHKILIAMDSSDISQYVFDEALALAKAMGANLMLLHVLSPEEEESPNLPGIPSRTLYADLYPGLREDILMNYRQQWDAFARKCLHMLRSRTAQANTAGVTAEFTQTPGTPGITICELARSWDAELIVIGRRGRSGLSELIMGSVSNYVLHHAPCSVLTVQPLMKHTETQSDQSDREILVS